MKISILGAGSWGTAIAIHLNRLGHQITLWMRNKNQFKEIVSTRHNRKYLDADIPQEIFITTDLEEAAENSSIVVIAVPSHAVREISKKLKDVIDKKAIVVNLAKGIETSTLKRMSEVIKEYLSNDVVVLSGPSHAEEVVKQIPTACVLASDDIKPVRQYKMPLWMKL